MSCSNLKPACADLSSDFEQLVATGLNRRRFLAGMGIAAVGTFLGGTPSARVVANTPPLIGFKPVPISTADNFIVPEGYSARPLISWGDPLFPDAPALDPTGTQSPSAQALQFGDSNDGMSFFALDDNRGLLAINNEFANLKTLYSHEGTAITADDVIKAQYAHGVSIVEIERSADGLWYVNQNSTHNRRIHMLTPMEMAGPAAGHALLQTSADDTGFIATGTLGNCANGKTPWGTYLTCEENFQDYFGSTSDEPMSAIQQRYGLKHSDIGTQWYLHDERFDLSKHPNEANRFGWIVEIDPHNPRHVPRKRTALGRFAHENAELVLSEDGHVVVYMGDDARGEHIYRFVSRDRFDPQNPAGNRNLLDAGTLYVARFAAATGELHGTGEWIALVHGQNGLTAESGFSDQAEILINTRLAATVAGGTTMDRPEWIVVHPHNQSVFCTLTNNHNRGVADNQPVGGPNPRATNHYGQILRWMPADGDHTSVNFHWDLFVLAGNPAVHPGTAYSGSNNINTENMFNSPDGLAIDADGRLWIQTDGNFSNTGNFAGMGNNQMLCANPLTNEIRRFATGPCGCELTGIAFSPDQRTLFVGVQHPGMENSESHFPAGGTSKPRSTVMMIQKDDGGVIGS